jgi:hypothetical protein
VNINEKEILNKFTLDNNLSNEIIENMIDYFIE